MHSPAPHRRLDHSRDQINGVNPCQCGYPVESVKGRDSEHEAEPPCQMRNPTSPAAPPGRPHQTSSSPTRAFVATIPASSTLGPPLDDALGKNRCSRVASRFRANLVAW
jgi:hypothetical protein